MIINNFIFSNLMKKNKLENSKKSFTKGKFMNKFLTHITQKLVFHLQKKKRKQFINTTKVY